MIRKENLMKRVFEEPVIEIAMLADNSVVMTDVDVSMGDVENPFG